MSIRHVRLISAAAFTTIGAVIFVSSHTAMLLCAQIIEAVTS